MIGTTQHEHIVNNIKPELNKLDICKLVKQYPYSEIKQYNAAADIIHTKSNYAQKQVIGSRCNSLLPGGEFHQGTEPIE